MYPTVVIVLVETQRSMTDFCQVNCSTQSRESGSTFAATSNRLPFTVETVTKQAIPTEKESRYERSSGCISQVEDGQQRDCHWYSRLGKESPIRTDSGVCRYKPDSV